MAGWASSIARSISALGRPVALKVIAPTPRRRGGLPASASCASRASPRRSTTRTSCPVYAAGEDGRRAVHRDAPRRGRTCAEIAAARAARAARGGRLVRQIAEALDAAHARGLVHRDVKPANVLSSQHGGSEHAYLTDFGLTKRRRRRPRPGDGGDWVGTLDYVAPEQLRGERVDGRADVYSLGCVLYQCLTGQVPFPGERPRDALGAHIRRAARRPPTLFPPVCPVVCPPFVRERLAKTPEPRLNPRASWRGRRAKRWCTRRAAKRATGRLAPPTRPRHASTGGGLRLYDRERELGASRCRTRTPPAPDPDGSS